MGVFAANLAFNNAPVFNIKYALAINGTPLGIDELYGIKQSDFKSSMDNFNFALFKKGCFLKDLSRVDFGFNENAKAELNDAYNEAINAPKQNSEDLQKEANKLIEQQMKNNQQIIEQMRDFGEVDFYQ